MDRSLLFVPGDRSDRFQKAAAAGADCVILDLEDAVAPAAKVAARHAVAAWLAAGHCAMVRINACDTEWHREDLEMVRATKDGGLMLPKADPESLRDVVGVAGRRPVIALVETVRGYLALAEMSSVSGLHRLAFGSVDFSLESGIVDQGDALTSVRNGIVLASALAGLAPPIDGVSVELNDLQQISHEARRSESLGFGGKLCIHPRQVPAVNRAFEPDAESVEWAGRVVAAAQSSGGAAFALDGRMVDKPVLERAHRILKTANR